VPFEGAGADHPCGECLARPPRFAAVIAPFSYGGSVAAAVCALKYAGRTDLSVRIVGPLGLLDFPPCCVNASRH
jgi:predicted amidophosphoribosyltransferase